MCGPNLPVSTAVPTMSVFAYAGLSPHVEAGVPAMRVNYLIRSNADARLNRPAWPAVTPAFTSLRSKLSRLPRERKNLAHENVTLGRCRGDAIRIRRRDLRRMGGGNRCRRRKRPLAGSERRCFQATGPLLGRHRRERNHAEPPGRREPNLQFGFNECLVRRHGRRHRRELRRQHIARARWNRWRLRSL